MQLESEVGVDPARTPRRGRVVEIVRGPDHGQLGLAVPPGRRDLKPGAQARAIGVRVGGRQFELGGRSAGGLPGQAQTVDHTASQRIPISRPGAGQGQAVSDRHAARQARHQIGRAIPLHLVRDADGDGIAIRVQAGDGQAEKQRPADGIELVIDEALLRG